MLLQKVVEKSNSKNLKVIKNTLPNKSWNPEDLKNNHSHCVKVSKYGLISGPYFPVFSPNTGKYGPEVIVFGHFSSSEQLESSSANINIVDEDLLRTFYKFFCLWFLVFQVISEKHCATQQRICWEFERNFYMKIVETVIFASLVTNWLSYLFCPFIKAKTKIKFSAGWWSGNQK